MTDKAEILQLLGPSGIYGADIRKVGSRYKMRCAFHEEKTPSFIIYPDTLAFHCYGCGEGGSAFDYVMKKEGVPFEEALKMLAEKAGVKVTLNPQQNSRIYEANRTAMEFYQDALTKNPKAIEYMTVQRGFTEETIQKFKLGCTAPTTLTQHLFDKGFTEREILEAGLAAKRDGKLKDYFFRRVVFPILRGTKVLGFSARIVGAGEPKYLNSPATAVFQKSETLYGFDPMAVKEAGFLILVEGNPDVIMAHQCGYRNTAAALGTAVTEHHAAAIKKCTDRVLLIFDGDKAGKNAARRSTKLLFDAGLKGAVITLPEGEDPDTFLTKGNRFESLYPTAVPFASHLVNSYSGTRSAIYMSLITRGMLLGDPFETAEFLAYSGTDDETDLFRELQARALLEAQMRNARILYKMKDMEVRAYHDSLALFVKGKFLLAKKAGNEPRTQAADMVRSMQKIRSRAIGFKTNERK